jgi:lipoprotein-anchoring transpeptidase ErfK/SrfK
VRAVRAIAVIGAAAVVLGASGPASASSVVHAAPAGAASRPAPPTVRDAWIAHIITATPGWSAPGHRRVRATISTSAGPTGGPVALLVLDARVLNGTTWLRVLLPRRPNGSSVWIDANLVRLTRTPWRIDISLERRTVTLLRGGRVVRRSRAVLGKPSTPTPTGLFSVYQRVRQTDPNAFLGSWALLLSGFSNVLRRFDGGPGRFAIHGRGGASLLDPLGTARSHGCIRIDNSAIDLLAADVGDGTPVRISRSVDPGQPRG